MSFNNGATINIDLGGKMKISTEYRNQNDTGRNESKSTNYCIVAFNLNWNRREVHNYGSQSI